MDREITEDFIKKMSAGVHIVDEEKGLDAVTRPCTVRREGKYTFSIILTQGLNRQIRRMCRACGCRVRTLKRVRIMNVRLGDLRPGEYRKVTGEELETLRALAGCPAKKQTGEAIHVRGRK